MTDFPRDIPAFQAALLAYALPTAPEEGDDPWAQQRTLIATAQTASNVAPAAVSVLDAFKDRVADLDASSLTLLAGAANLISSYAWFGRGPDAVAALLAAVVRLDAPG
jgi:hypothetical protein